jgi:hypothetical protein
MDAQSTETLEDLADRVAKLERLAGAQARYLVELLNFAPVEPTPPDGYLTIAEAAAFASMALSTFRQWRKRVGLKPAITISGRPRYWRSEVESALERGS